MDLSIIIISYNTCSLLRNCLKSICETLKNVPFSFELIVIDNKSEDGTREMIDQEFSRVKLIKNNKNLGFGQANNQGIAVSKGEYILLLNSDTVVQEQAIPKLFQFIKVHTRVFVGAKLFNTDRTTQPSCGPFFTLPVVFALLFLRGDQWGLTRWSPKRITKVDWVSGACIMVKKSTLNDDLSFDTGIFMYMEEIDLLYRAGKKGYTVYFYPSAEFIHAGSGSSIDTTKSAIINIYRGLLYFYKKHKSKDEIFVIRQFLKLKAILGIITGVFLGNNRLKETYEEAYRVV